MRTIFVGATVLTVMTARKLLEAGHNVVIIDQDEGRIAELAETLDCGFIHGDGSRPAVLEELSPGENDILLCLSGDDQDNIIASLVGRTMEFSRVITKIEDPDFEVICTKLGLENVLVPDRDLGERLADLVEGHDTGDLSAAVASGIRFFRFIVREQDAARVSELDLPQRAHVIVRTRDGESTLVDEDDELKPDDLVLVVVHQDDLEQLKERYARVTDE
jgi:trk system potassium uptake protein TrkA